MLIRLLKIIITAVFLFLQMPVLDAETGNDTVEGKITVYGDENGVGDKIPVAVDVVDFSENPISKKSTEAIGSRPGVQVKRLNEARGSAVSIRGSNPNQVAIYLDGVRVNDVYSGEFNIDDIPPENIKRIEIYKGFTSPGLIGSNTGGAINIVTRDPERDSVEAGVGYGSYDTTALDAIISKKAGNFNFLFSADRRSTDGDYIYVNNSGTPHSPKDDFKTRVKNNNSETCSFFSKAGYRGADYSLSFFDNFYRRETGLAGIDSVEIKRAEQKTVRNIAGIGFETYGILSENLDSSNTVSLMNATSVFNDPKGELSQISIKDKMDTCGIDVAGQFKLYLYNPSQNMILSYGYSRETAERRRDTTERINFPEQYRDMFSVSVSDDIGLFNGRLHILPLVGGQFWRNDFFDEYRYSVDRVEKRTATNNESAYGQIGVLVNVIKENLFFKANYGSGYRIPSFGELFGDSAYVMGNTSLSPERSINRDIGFGGNIKLKNFVIDSINYSNTLFYNSISDVIVLTQNSRTTLMPQNISRAKIYGDEISLGIGLFGHLILEGNYTFQKAIDKGDIPYYRNKLLPYKPVHEASFLSKIYFAVWETGYTIDYTGYNFRDRANSRIYYLDKRIIHSWYMTVMPMTGLKVRLDLKNITDEMAEDVIGYHLPGRTYFVSANYKF